MATTIAWIVLLAAGVLWEIGGHLSHGRWTGLTALGAVVASRPLGTLVLIGIWAFIGWHLFARYTLPG